jgi:putative membrane protein
MRLQIQSLSTLALGGVLALAAPFCAAQQAGTQPSRSAMRANQQAADLMNTINKSEISTAKMMAGHTQNAQVKDFADMLANDHQQAQTRLESTASASNINLREGPMMMRHDRATEEHLKAMTPAAADRAFAADQVREHEHAIAQLKKLEPQVTDPQLKTEIKDYLPVLRKHLAEAKKLEGELRKPAGPGQ